MADMRPGDSSVEQAMNTDMSRSEKIVAGLAVAVLVAGFTTGVFAKSPNTSMHGSVLPAHLVATQARRND